jgi:hypothetical protein
LSTPRRANYDQTTIAQILLAAARRQPNFPHAPSDDRAALKQILDGTKDADLDLIVNGGILPRSRAEAAMLALIEAGKMRLHGSAMLKSLKKL